MNKKICPLKAVGYHLILSIIEESTPEEKSSNGIIVEIHKPKDIRISETGYVVDIGATAFSEIGGSKKVGIKEGDKVIFSKHAGLIKRINGYDFRIINDTDVLAVLHTRRMHVRK